MSDQPIALILGATGGIGGETARALARRDFRIRALARDPAGAAAHPNAGPGWEWIGGDATDAASVARASEGASLIVHAVNPPGYRNWGGLVLPMLDNTIAAARASGARVLLPGTIYNYGPDAGSLVREDSPQHPDTRKGAIRVEMEARLQAASGDGVRVLIVRAGDYFGPKPGNGWFSQALVKSGRPVRSISNPGREGVGHAWSYLPDVAETFARLAERDAELPAFARFHFGGHWDEEGAGMVSAIHRSVGDPRVKIRALPWRLLAALSPFQETLRELMEMKSFWRRPVRLDNTRLLAFLGSEPHTPLDEAVRTTLLGLKCLGAQNAAQRQPPLRHGTAAAGL